MIYALKTKSGNYIHQNSRLVGGYRRVEYTTKIYEAKIWNDKTSAKRYNTIVNNLVKIKIENQVKTNYVINFVNFNGQEIYEEVEVVVMELREVP